MTSICGPSSLAAGYALEVARFVIETTIIVPGSFTHGTSHFANSGHSDDDAVTADRTAAAHPCR